MKTKRMAAKQALFSSVGFRALLDGGRGAPVYLCGARAVDKRHGNGDAVAYPEDPSGVTDGSLGMKRAWRADTPRALC